MGTTVTAAELAAALSGTLAGDGGIKLSGISDLKNSGSSDASFILSEKHAEEAAASRAPVIISDSLSGIKGKAVIKVGAVKQACAKAIAVFFPEKPVTPGISPKAAVSKNAKLGKGVFVDDCAVIKDNASIGAGAAIGAGVFIGAGSSIGKNSKIYPNVSVYDNCEVGDNTIIHSGCVIGADGFGFVPDGNKMTKVPQIGRVKIGNSVEIGANCTVDRAAFGATVLKDGVKLDNMVHIGHNCEIGDNTIIVAQTGVSGSVIMGKNCVIGGQVGFVDHITIGDRVQVNSQSGVAKDLPDGIVVTGTPARPFKEQRRAEAYVMRLEELFKKVKEIEKKTENK
jgi:UDP-3-O-[3-hydroxymyristoyl] glucosamine N-acyltransferase